MRNCVRTMAIVSVVLAAGCARYVAPAGCETASGRAGLALGVQAYTFRSLTLFETIDTLNTLGVRYIEMYPGQQYSRRRRRTSRPITTCRRSWSMR